MSQPIQIQDIDMSTDPDPKNTYLNELTLSLEIEFLKNMLLQFGKYPPRKVVL